MSDKQTFNIDAKTLRALLEKQPTPQERPEPLSYSIGQWCERHSISRSTFYNLKKQGRAPDLIFIGDLPRIAAAADLAWQKAQAPHKTDVDEVA
jgi:predicted DNA-binding transcriptional regulator AlpA